MAKFKAAARAWLNRLGWDLHRYEPEDIAYYRLSQGLSHAGIDLVFDVGANAGQFCQELRRFGYRGRFVSFEPLSDAHQRLAANAADDAGWLVHSRTAIGDHDGEIAINVAGNSVSSSVMPMLASHAEAAPRSAYVGAETVPIARLDTLAGEYLSRWPDATPLLKIDTQGFEWQVLDGAPDMLAKARGVYCELTLVPLYEGQRLWLDLIARLEAAGFVLWSVFDGFADMRDGRSLQIDALFLREPR